MSKSARLIFFGTENFSVPSLEALLKADWPLLAIVTKPDSKAGRGQKVTEPKIKKIAESHKIKVLQPQKVSEINDQISQLQPTHGVLVAYGKIIPQSTLDLFPEGIINVHPSLLPQYRGPAPVEAAILNGDKQTGISLMRLEAKMDAGPVYYQEHIKLSGREDRLSLNRDLSQRGAELLTHHLPKIIDGELQPKSQDDSAATYTKLLKKGDGVMDWNQPAEVLERQVRAYAGWPKSVAEVSSQKIIVTKARVAKDKNDGALVMQANPGYLEIQELVAPSGRTMSGGDFLRGYKS
jgi:methionyl-tRNA formyltransferase